MENLERHEQKFAKDPHNPFISQMANIIDESTPQDLVNIINLIEKDLSKTKLSVEQFTLLGAYIYMLGIETFNQPYLNQRAIIAVHERLAKYEIHPEAYRLVIDIVLRIKEFHVDIVSVKDSIKVLIDAPVYFKDIDAKEFAKMVIAIKGVFKNSLIPIKYVCNANDILKKRDKMTYNDLITINNIINEECHYVGANAKNALIKLNSNKVFQSLIKVAIDNHEAGKYSLLHFDHIITMVEYSERTNMELVYSAIMNKLSPEDYSLITDQYTANKKADEEAAAKLEKGEIEKVPEQVGPVNTMTPEESQKLMETNPVEVIFIAFDEVLKRKAVTAEDILEALVILTNSPDDENVQQLYGYMSKMAERITKDSLIPIRQGMDVGFIVNTLRTEFEAKQLAYKELVEFICAPIPSDVSNRIKTYVIECIKSLVLETKDQKNYLLSMMIEPQLDTYNQLQQIVSLIETCKIDGGNMISYVSLYEYLKYSDEIVEIFDKSQGIEATEVELSMAKMFINWFSILNEVKSVEADEIMDADDEITEIDEQKAIGEE